MARRWQDPQSASELGRLDPEAIARVREEAWPDPVNAEELHDSLLWMSCLTVVEAKASPGVVRLARGAGPRRTRRASEAARGDALDSGRAGKPVPIVVAGGATATGDLGAARPPDGVGARSGANRNSARTTGRSRAGDPNRPCGAART